MIKYRYAGTGFEGWRAHAAAMILHVPVQPPGDHEMDHQPWFSGRKWPRPFRHGRQKARLLLAFIVVETYGDALADAPLARGDDWSGRTRTADPRLEKAWFDLVATASTADESPPRTREVPLRRGRQKDRAPPDLPLFAWEPAVPSAQEHDEPAGEELENVVQFPGLRL